MDVQDLLEQRREPGQGQEAVGDGGTERFPRRPPGGDVDPLTVAGYRGEAVDALLGNALPGAVAEVAAGVLRQLVERDDRGCSPVAGSLEALCGRGPSSSATSCPRLGAARIGNSLGHSTQQLC